MLREQKPDHLVYSFFKPEPQKRQPVQKTFYASTWFWLVACGPWLSAVDQCIFCDTLVTSQTGTAWILSPSYHWPDLWINYPSLPVLKLSALTDGLQIRHFSFASILYKRKNKWIQVGIICGLTYNVCPKINTTQHVVSASTSAAHVHWLANSN